MFFFLFGLLYTAWRQISYLLYHRGRFILVGSAKLLTTCKPDNKKIIHQHITYYYHNTKNGIETCWSGINPNFQIKNWFDLTHHVLRYTCTCNWHSQIFIWTTSRQSCTCFLFYDLFALIVIAWYFVFLWHVTANSFH